ncbi:ribokinase, partial [Mesorhizobium sp. M4A.F.Ca.ET.020.02.1.1]|uniref:PfkB family carbohydrate kinase n=1 Tax=Mesorhizobium sp. M4A.F.Ca.ET.020.02.1.1 TaxID=2496652 RepID=UPI000FD20E40
MNTKPRPVVVAVGSLHYDIMVDAPDRPRKGETVTGFGWRPKFGGKGGNQAIAAARAGADVRMAGAIGDDDFGRVLLANLTAAGVDASRIAHVAGRGSGMSGAISDSGGDYGAVIVSGANTALDPGILDDGSLWRGAGVLILQNEMPDAVNLAAAKAAKRAGVPVCLNAAPHRSLTDEFIALVDIM